MIEMVGQKQLRQLQSLGFCYLCGREFNEASEKTRDHVPPKTVFLTEHRSSPLILPTHGSCNQDQSSYDEMIGQLISYLHGTPPSDHNLRLSLRAGRRVEDGAEIAFTQNLNIDAVVWRWIRGFHAALYGEYLPEDSKRHVHSPFPQARLSEGNTLEWKSLLPQQPLIVEEIKKNRMTPDFLV